MSKAGGLPRDTLFRKTESAEGSPKVAPKRSPAKRKVSMSQSKQRDENVAKEIPSDSSLKTTEAPRQTYYVPTGLHKQLKMLAIERDVNVSDLVVEGIEWIVAKNSK